MQQINLTDSCISLLLQKYKVFFRALALMKTYEELWLLLHAWRKEFVLSSKNRS
jgi:hypothetical protein